MTGMLFGAWLHNILQLQQWMMKGFRYYRNTRKLLVMDRLMPKC